jgi:lipopolysaccharide/colanic/teichoic acid biosynthesis glycosyltransferase
MGARRREAALDLLAGALAMAAAPLLAGGVRPAAAGWLLCIVLAALAFPAALRTFDLDRGLWCFASPGELARVALAAGLSVLAVAVAAAALPAGLTPLPRPQPLIPLAFVQWLVLVALACGARLAAAAARPSAPAVPHRDWAPILLVGAGEGAFGLIRLLRAGPPALPWTVAGILADDPAARGRTLHDVPVLGRSDELPEVAARLAVHGVPLAMLVLSPGAGLDEGALVRLRETAARLDLPVLDAGGFLRLHAARLRQGAARPVQRPGFSGKRLADIVLAACLLVLALPVLLLVAGLVAACHGRPVLFGQMRPGYAMRPIRVLKFRTMRFACSPAGEQAPDAARLTVLGRILRRTRLDELPQLWNVLKGDMSLIGPRPLLPRDLPAVAELLSERFSVRPGITGLAQISGGDRLSPEEKLAFDLWYVRHHGLRLDLEIALLTLWTMLAGDRDRFGGAGPALAGGPDTGRKG